MSDDVFKVLQRLSLTSSTKDKVAILTENKDNELLKKVIVAALDPFVVYSIKKIPHFTPRGNDVLSMSLESGVDALGKLADRTYTGNAAIEWLQNILNKVNVKNGRIICAIIGRNLDCGVSVALVNRVWPGLVPDYPCMLASQYDVKKLNKFTWPAIGQVKVDGMRFNAIVDSNGGVEFRSRNGKLLDLLGHLHGQFADLGRTVNAGKVVFDGELVVQNNGKIVDRQTGNGILSKCQKGTITDAEAANIVAIVWDVILYNDFVAGKCSVPYFSRLGVLNNSIRKCNIDNKIRVVETFPVDSIDHAREMFDQYLNSGHEGIIVKDANSIWENKRSTKLIKFKGENECDLICTDWVEGTGKNVGRLGALTLTDQSKTLVVNVGTGFTDIDRDTIDRSVIGKVISVKYNAKIVDKNTGINSLFLPVFVEVRNDKDVADDISTLV